MSTKQYLIDNPDMLYYWENRVYKVADKNGHKQAYVTVPCSKCGRMIETRWNPLFSSYGVSLKDYTCKDCNKRILGEGLTLWTASQSVETLSIKSKKAMETMGVEGLKSRAENMQISKGPEGRSECSRKGALTQIRNSVGFFSDEARRKAYETASSNGTFMRSQLELDIEKEFGGQHSSPEFMYELDCYWPELCKGIEVDDKTHATKRIGYHKEKDDYFKSLGIEVLHISLSPDAVRRPGYSNWRDLVEHFLYEGIEDSLLYMEDDPYHING